MGQLNFPQSEEDVLKQWKEQDIFGAVQKKESPMGEFVFFEGPPTANAAPAVHHILARVFKDVILRFKTMQGFHIDRKAGWDTHGLPVEIQVEKKLGISGKPQIENIVPGDSRASIIEFNKQCKETVWGFLSEWEKLTERIGFWLDTKDPYVTYSNDYIQSVWWVFIQIWDKGLVYKGYKVVPYCTRCGTALSSHEVAQGYKTVKDVSVYVKFKVHEEKNTYLISWTTTPWTLPGNVALAVGEEIDYVMVEMNGEQWIMSKNGKEKIAQDANVIKEMKGSDLIGYSYEPLFNIEGMQNDASYKVYGASFVTDTDGVGVVHIAPMYGEDDYTLGAENGLPEMHTVDSEGNFVAEVTELVGRRAKNPETEKRIIELLTSRNLLVAEEKYEHEYPFCWRCSTPLLYYARDSWFIRMEHLHNKLLSQNETIRWEPDYIKEGRFGEWLANARDWAISRERYWGTPMPVWECVECGETVAFGSLKELGVTEEIELHRPYVDDILVKCKKCGAHAKRVSEVLDVWFDSGAMPIAQWGFPNVPGSEERLTDHYPADYICEAIDQTRGWFYTMLAIATLLEKEAPYKNVICLGHILDSKGEKMSKSKGNIVDPWDVINTQGVDPLRWYLFTASVAGEPKRFDLTLLEQSKRRTLMIFWNVVEFYSLYSHLVSDIVKEKPHLLDLWITSRVNQAMSEVTHHLERYDVTRAGRVLYDCIDDLSTWYVRRSRDRFKDGSVSAVTTLRDVLYSITSLVAPFTPFFAETVYKKLGGTLPSVHLADWPSTSNATVDETVLNEMKLARHSVELGQALRAEAKMKVRQPLASVAIVGATFSKELKEIIADELNVKEVVDVAGEGWITKQDGALSVSLNITLTIDLKKEGFARELIRTVNSLRKESGLSLDDRISVTISGSEEIESIVNEYRNELLKATLADEYLSHSLTKGTELVSEWGTVTLDISKK